MLTAVSCGDGRDGSSGAAEGHLITGGSSINVAQAADAARGRRSQGQSDPGAVTVRQDGALGQVVTDGAGNTLYRFDGDTADPPRSTCEGGCADTWPPVLAEGVTAGPGIVPGLLGSVERADGSRQLTLGGRPLYRYARDVKPGATDGHGLLGAWFAAAPDGSVAEKRLPALSVIDNPDLGGIVRDLEGYTLYRFLKDRRGESSCKGKCLDIWAPADPVILDEVSGVPIGLLGVITRPDGKRQLTLDGWPLYRYKGEDAPGAISGHGVDNQWFAVTPEGLTASVKTLRAR
jgi:predicted lipoprotein with Yx(FWY)xxD motif